MTRLHDADLLAFIDGQASAEVIELVERSAGYKARVGELKRLQARLRVMLHRADCPDSLVIGEYFQGLLHPNQSAAVQNHLRLCPYCHKEYADLQEFFTRSASPDPGPLKRARTLIATLLSGNQPRLATGIVQRGGEAPLIYAAGEVQILVNLKPDPRRPERKSLAGLVWGEATAGWVIQLLKDNILAATATVDEMGNFLFADLEAGDYELRLYAPDEDITVSPLHVE